MAGLVLIALAIATPRDHDVVSVIVVFAVTVVCLQLGYIAGIAMWYGVGGIRVSSGRDHSRLASRALPNKAD